MYYCIIELLKLSASKCVNTSVTMNLIEQSFPVPKLYAKKLNFGEM